MIVFFPDLLPCPLQKERLRDRSPKPTMQPATEREERMDELLAMDCARGGDLCQGNMTAIVGNMTAI